MQCSDCCTDSSPFPWGLSQHVTGIGITLLAASLTYFTYRISAAGGVLTAEDRAVQGPLRCRYCPISRCSARRCSTRRRSPISPISPSLSVAFVLLPDTGGRGSAGGGRESIKRWRPRACRSPDDADGRRDRQAPRFMAVGGAFLTMSAFNSFFFEMMNGRGWICIALVVFGCMAAGQGADPRCAILFAAFRCLCRSDCSRRYSAPIIPYQIFLMMPYRVLHPSAGGDVARRAEVSGGA
jgi:hypothetical protein